MRVSCGAKILTIVIALGWSFPGVAAQTTPPTKTLGTIEEKSAGWEKHDGFIPYYWDAGAGKVWIEISRWDEDFLYIASLATGLGSNPVGLDRSQIGGGRVVRFQRVGPKVLLVQRNLRYRAVTDDADEKRAVAESFAESVLWGAEVAAETNGTVLVDATEFLLRDAVDVIGRLQRANQGSYSLDRGRSAIYLDRTKAFPDNTEFEATLTFSTARGGRLVSEVTPSAEAVSLREHQSFVKLPDLDYQTRVFDPRSSSYGITFADYATPLSEPLDKRWIARHRLRKKDPGAAISDPVEPIVYYLDRGAPEPVRSALLEGARWWNQAFEAAGYRDAFQVELLPEGADPMDIRYNVIQWVHRSTRGWSYGSSVLDPRTGEILKGHVLLGSLRVRQDRLILESLQPVFNASIGNCGMGGGLEASYLAQFDPNLSPVDVALARIRQLAAHEVGHTLGFAHNFAASANDRASVMDYPAPLVQIAPDGSLDLGDAYAVGIGAWDKIAVRYAYSDFPAGTDEKAALEGILAEAAANGLLFLTDEDARPPGAAQPLASLWDNGADPIQALRDVMKVRRTALAQFGLSNIPVGAPMSDLENPLVPLYLYHRYQTEATVKMLGGVFYQYKVRGDSLPNQSVAPPQKQREALAAVLETVSPSELALSERTLELIHPLAFGYDDTRERFPSHTGQIFDPLAAASTAANLTLSALLDPERAARLEIFHARNPENPGLGEVIEAIVAATWRAPRPSSEWVTTVGRVIQDVTVARLIGLAGDERASSAVRATTSNKLRNLAEFLATRENRGGLDGSHAAETRRWIESFLDRPYPPYKPTDQLEPPPGSPIG